MSCAPPIERAEESSALALTMRALRPLLADREVTELCINRPREAFVESHRGWQRRALPYADSEWCSRLAKLIANSTQQRVDSTAPLCLPPCRQGNACRWCYRRRPRPAV